MVTVWTHATSRPATPLALEAIVERATALAPVARALGFQDVQLGDAAFDAAFVVRASDPALVRQAIGPALRQALTSFPRRASLRYRRGGVELTWEGLEVEPSVLVAALTLVARAARCSG